MTRATAFGCRSQRKTALHDNAFCVDGLLKLRPLPEQDYYDLQAYWLSPMAGVRLGKHEAHRVLSRLLLAFTLRQTPTLSCRCGDAVLNNKQPYQNKNVSRGTFLSLGSIHF